jgi:hypothetical protein
LLEGLQYAAELLLLLAVSALFASKGCRKLLQQLVKCRSI